MNAPEKPHEYWRVAGNDGAAHVFLCPPQTWDWMRTQYPSAQLSTLTKEAFMAEIGAAK